MKKNILKKIISVVIIIILLGTATFIFSSSAQGQTGPFPGTGSAPAQTSNPPGSRTTTQDSATGIDDLDFQGVVNIFNGLAYIALYLVGAILAIYGIWIAIKFIAGGSSSSYGAGETKKRITWYVVGGVVLIATPTIIQFTVDLAVQLFGVEDPDVIINVPPDTTLITGAERIADSVSKMLLGFGVAFFVIMMLWGAIIWMAAGDNEDNTRKARSIFTNAIIGALIIVGLAFIVGFLFQLTNQVFTIDTSATVENRIDVFAEKLVQILSGIAVSISVIVIVWSAILYMTAGGDDTQTQRAKNMLKNGIIGALVIVGLAFIVGLIFQVGIDIFG